MLKFANFVVLHSCTVCVVNNRGASDIPSASSKFTHPADCSDLHFVLKTIRDRYIDSKIIAIGASLGGILISRYLIESGKDSNLDAALLFSVPWNLRATIKNIEKPGFGQLFNRQLTRCKIKRIKRDLAVLEPEAKRNGVDMKQVLISKRMEELLFNFTVKMTGFASLDDYYRETDLTGKIHMIKRPVLCVSAADDIVVPEQCKSIQVTFNESLICGLCPATRICSFLQ